MSCTLRCSTKFGLFSDCLSTKERNVPFFKFDFIDAIDCFQCCICTSILAISPIDSTGILGPFSDKITPAELHILDRDKSKISTPNQFKTAALSGPPIPGVHNNEPGNLFFRTWIALTSLPA